MEPVIMDPRWALLTLILTALLGLTLWLALMVIISSRKVSKVKKRVAAGVAFAVFGIWLFTVGNPESTFNLERLYYRSINYLPQGSFGKIFRPKGSSTNAVATNSVSTVITNK